MAVADPSSTTTITGFRSLKRTQLDEGRGWDVFSGYSEELNREVDLTVVHAEALRDEQTRKKFAEVAKVVAVLQHPLLQRCLMVVPMPDGGWSVMCEPVEGPTLQDHLSRTGALSCDDAVQLVMLLCEAVDAAHQRGVVHGGLSPRRVLLPGGLHAFRPKLTGIALGLLPSSETAPFAAPELQERRGEPSPLADVYSLGALLYTCLTGKAPDSHDVKKLKALPAGAEHLVPVLERAMALEFSRRYFTAGELAKALLKANGTLVPPAQRVDVTSPLTPLPQQGLPSDTMLGPYQLVRLLGEGSMGQVFLGRHKALGRQVAIKVLRPEQYRRGDLIQRFFQEARTVNQINHEHIVEIFDFVQEPGPDGPSAVYCVMELLQGTSLTGAIEGAPMELKRALNITRQLCDALFAAHKVGVVHRDVKPDNIFLIERAGQKDYVKVLDFGVAKLTHAQPDTPLISTMDGAIIGTPMCMAPEQAAGAAVDHRADIYAVGVILYLMLTGQLPFEAKTFAALAVLLITKPPPPIPDLTPSKERIEPALKALVLKCLEKEPANRPQSMRELAEGLTPFMSMSAVRASDPALRPVAPQMKPRPASSAKWLALGAVALAATAAGVFFALQPRAQTAAPPPPVVVVQPPQPPPPQPPPVEPVKPPVEPVVEELAPLADPPPKPPPPVKPVTLKKEMIAETVRRGSGDVRKCIERHRTDLKTLEGHVDVKLTIELAGDVKNAVMTSDTLKGSSLEGCVLKEVRRFRFPRHVGPAPTIIVPFNYKLTGG
ncbi:MAG: protein kinase [Archangiaceae bacterium]|nr:protein kinase [Archangiaceae bacterium]